MKIYKGQLQQSLSTKLSIPKKAPKDKRVTIGAFQNFGSGEVRVPREGEGSFDVRLSVAINSAAGMLSEESRAHLKMRRPLSQFGGEFTSVTATYMEDGQGGFLGLRLQAFEQDNVAIGEAQLFEGTAEVDLRIQQTQTQLITMARPSPAGWPSADAPATGWTIISSQDIPVPNRPFTLAFGAQGLMKKATFFFDFFSFGAALLGPELELGLFHDLAGAVLDLGQARDALIAEPADLDLAEDELNDARDTLVAAQSDLQKAMGADNLDETTQGKLAAKLFKRTLKGAGRLIKTLEKGKAKKPAKLMKPAQRVIDDTLVVMANLAGMKTTNARQITFVTPNP
ncbi:MAG: hypothetical protein DRQ55_12650 [Planctomycetota bacterium]|nr:MAG: hypothetical protein DRQ55_12650 [Planctomycetota bacterium]